MDRDSFQNFVLFLQNTQSIISNLDLRRKAYYEFNLVFDYLAGNIWSEDNLIERHEYTDKAVFQNIGEGYYRLGFIENVFFQYSKLIYELWYKKAIEKQGRISKRIHKGTQLHQIAEIYSAQNSLGRAWTYYLSAFVEDVIDDRNYTQSQAFRALLRQGLTDKNLLLVAKNVVKLKSIEKRDPLQIVERLKRDFKVPTYEENGAIDYLKLSKAKELWDKLRKERNKTNGSK